MNGVQIRVGDLLYAIGKRWKMILAFVLVGCGFGAAAILAAASTSSSAGVFKRHIVCTGKLYKLQDQLFHCSNIPV